MRGRLLIFSALLFCMLFCGCVQDNQKSLSPGNYVAIQQEKSELGRVVNGTVPFPGLAQITTQFYYNKSERYPLDYPPINESFKGILGTYYRKESVERLTTYLITSGIYSLPYETESGVTILDIDNNGTLVMTYDYQPYVTLTPGTTHNAQYIHLPPGATWDSPVISTINETRTGNFTGIDYNYTISYSTTWRITNKGVFNK